MFTFSMTDEDAQRVYAIKLAADYQSNTKADLLLKEKVKKEGVLRNQKNSRETGLRLIEKKRTESMPRNYQSNAEADLLLKENVKKEGVPRNYKNRMKLVVVIFAMTLTSLKIFKTYMFT